MVSFTYRHFTSEHCLIGFVFPYHFHGIFTHHCHPVFDCHRCIQCYGFLLSNLYRYIFGRNICTNRCQFIKHLLYGRRFFHLHCKSCHIRLRYLECINGCWSRFIFFLFQTFCRILQCYNGFIHSFLCCRFIQINRFAIGNCLSEWSPRFFCVFRIF